MNPRFKKALAIARRAKRPASLRAGDTRQAATKDEWLTPPEIIQALGPFDLDPCAPVVRPWSTAVTHYTIRDDGLAQPWFGRVWLNPPYGPAAGTWLELLATRGNGIALLATRTETKWFQRSACKADAWFFPKGRLAFHHVDGRRAGTARSPHVFLAFGAENVRALEDAIATGALKGIILYPRKAAA